MSAKSIYQAYSLLAGTSKVLHESVKIVSNDCAILSSFRGNDELFTEAKTVSEEARSKANNRPFNENNVSVSPHHDSEIDIFKLARTKSSEARHENHKQSDHKHNYSHNHKNNQNCRTSHDQKRSFHTTRIFKNSSDKSAKIIGEKNKPDVELTQSAVPSTRLGRLFHYGTLAASMGAQVLKDSASHYVKHGKAPDMKKLIMSPRNIELMARKFSQMRGAALKVGQMLSFQDNSVLPPDIQQILLRVQNSAHYMPAAQLEKSLSFELGDGWRGRLFASFDDIPIAAASIGQVHTAVTRKELDQVVVKVQYPGVADSIDSDLDNILALLTASKMLPPGLFLDKSIANARIELKWECDYIREAQNLVRYKELLKDEPSFVVPKVYHDLSDEHVLTMERMKGTEIVKGNWSQDIKNKISHNIMKLCLLEIYKFKFMQTDPNWANFLYNPVIDKVELLDFGACRGFEDNFIKNYSNCLRAAVKQDRESAKKYSLEMGFLTGLESEAMNEAHVDSILALGEPFRESGPDGLYDFQNQTITDRVRGNISLMLNERLTPPPEETYSLHRKLSGAYLLCARMNAKINSKQIFEEVIGLDYQ